MSTVDEHRNHFTGAGAGHWYVMQTKPRDESRVIHHLAIRAADVETFLPRIEVTQRRAGRKRIAFEPLFPNYVFVRCGLDPQLWNMIRWTPGVRRFLGEGTWPHQVPVELITAIQDRMEPLGFIRVGIQLRRGDRVRVKSGAFAGLEGMFERSTTRRDRVRVLLEILGTVTPLELEVFDLERV